MGNQNLAQVSINTGCDDWVVPAELNIVWPVSTPQARIPEKQAILANVIENEIIPRLLLANRTDLALASPAMDRTAQMLTDRIGEFSELVINREGKDAIDYIEGLRERGISLEALYQDLLAPTARRLGELWEEDINDFFDVTRGMGQLQHILRAFSDEFCDESRKPTSNGRALLMPLPGEEHTFGVSLLREHFLRAGWRVWCGQALSINEIVSLVKSQWFDLVGLSASAVNDPQELAASIRAIRSASTNKDLTVFVGGLAFIDAPGLVATVGADATASDARAAVTQMSNKIALRRL